MVLRYAAAKEALQRALTSLQQRDERIASLEKHLSERQEDLRRVTQELAHVTNRLEENQLTSIRLFDAFCSSLPGKLLGGRFEILHRIGSGGYGVVYQALDRRTHRDVALKLLRISETSYPTSNSLIYQLAHPNIAAVLESGVAAEGVPFVAMELLRGKNLAEVMAQRKALSVAQAARIAYEVCIGLAEAHRWNVVHRDIKPANVFLARQREGASIKILDFGLARVVRTLEVDGYRIAGTPAYVAPERLERKPYDWRVDVYATGMLVYEMFGVSAAPRSPASTAAEPRAPGARAPEAGAGGRWTETGWPPLLREVRPEVPSDVSHIAALAIRRNPKHRPTIKQMAEVFAQYSEPASCLNELLLSSPIRVTPTEELTLESIEHQSLGGADTIPLESAVGESHHVAP